MQTFVRRARRAWICACLLVCLSCALAQDAYIFYEEPCASCDHGEWLKLYLSLTSDLRAGSADGAVEINTFREGTDRLRDLLGDAAKRVELPAAVFPDGSYVAGEAAFRADVRRAYAAWRGVNLPANEAPDATESAAKPVVNGCETDLSASSGRAVWYLCAPYCESCLKAGEDLRALPADTAVWTVNASADAALAQALFDLFKVPADDRVAPSVFIGETALCGLEEIHANLARLASRGEAARTRVLPKPASRAPLVLIAFAIAALLAGAYFWFRRKRAGAGRGGRKKST